MAKRLMSPACDPSGAIRFILCCFERQGFDAPYAMRHGVAFGIDRGLAVRFDRLAPVEA